MNSISLWLKVKILQYKNDKHYKRYKKDEEKAKKENKSKKELHELGHMNWLDSLVYDDEIMELNTRYLYSKAQKLLLPVPDYDDVTMWEESNITGRRNLTNKGITTLRSAIRTEHHERRRGALTWVAALTGLIGALSGLVAVINANL